MEKSVLIMLFFGLEVMYLLRTRKNLLLLGLIVIMIVQVKNTIFQIDNIDSTDSFFEGQVTQVWDDKLILKTNQGNLMVYYSTDKRYLPGDSLEIQGQIFETDVPQIEHNFDYTSYLDSMKISGQFSASTIHVVNHSFDLSEIKERLSIRIEESFSDEISSYLKMFVLGDDSSVPDSVVSQFRNLGISHLFAISGMHVGLILLMIKKVLSIFYLKENTEKAITYSCLFFYNVLTGFSVSIVRASLLVFLIFLNKKKGWMFSKTDLLSFIFIAFMFVEPANLEQTGFQLSFLITLAILLSEPLLKEKSKLVQIIRLQLIATLFSLPIIMNMNGGYGLLSIFLSILFLEIITFVLLPLSFMTVIIPPMGGVYSFVIQLFIGSIEELSKLNPWIEFQFPTLEYTILFYLGAIILMIYVISKKRLTLPLSMIIYAIFFSLIHPVNPLVTKVVFLDVGQGDATYIQSPGCRLLIDTGKKDDFDSLIEYLKGENVHSLDAIFITHFHADHYGELDDILNMFEVKNLYASHFHSSFPNIAILNQGDTIHCGHLTFDVLHSDTASSNENNNSLVLSTFIGEDRYLFMGDLEEVEEKLIPQEMLPKVDVLKVGHHGSDTSSSAQFLSLIEPIIAIISVGENDYGQPSNTVLSRLKQIESVVFETKIHGSIKIHYYSIIDLRIITRFNFEDGVLSQRLLSIPICLKRLLF